MFLRKNKSGEFIMSRGGYRPGGGRPPGSKDKLPRKRAAKAEKPAEQRTGGKKKAPEPENLSPLDSVVRLGPCRVL